MQLLISRKVGKDNWKLDDLLREFRIELEARERCSLIHTTAEKKDTIRKTNEPYTSAALFTTGDTPQYKDVLIVGSNICHQNAISLQTLQPVEPSFEEKESVLHV